MSWGKVKPGRLPDAVVAYCDATIAFPLLCEYVVGSERGRRRQRRLFDRREALLSGLEAQARSATGPGEE